MSVAVMGAKADLRAAIVKEFDEGSPSIKALIERGALIALSWQSQVSFVYLLNIARASNSVPPCEDHATCGLMLDSVKCL